MYYVICVRRTTRTYILHESTYVIGVIIVFLKFVGNGKNLAIFDIGGAFGQDALRGSFDVSSQDTRRMRLVQLDAVKSAIMNEYHVESLTMTRAHLFVELKGT